MADTGPIRLVGEGLFEPAENEHDLPWLLGSRCSLCQEVVFPAMLVCPYCVTHASMRPQRLRGRGRLHQFVVTQRGPSGFPVPYVQAYVRLDDGPLAYSMIEGVADPDHDLHDGQLVEMSIAPIRHDGDVTVIGWKFHPVGGSDG
jgi:uncharacterized OB-fold protein